MHDAAASTYPRDVTSRTGRVVSQAKRAAGYAGLSADPVLAVAELQRFDEAELRATVPDYLELLAVALPLMACASLGVGCVSAHGIHVRSAPRCAAL